jgi:predicted nucleotidyltransferase component of viral defense system
MNYQKYKDQVALLLKVLPLIGGIKEFAIHGGTAINLFEQNMPRLSVDIDLTYLQIENRDISLKNINKKLFGLKKEIEKRFPDLNVIHNDRISKLIINNSKAGIKVEVNQIKRGCYEQSRLMPLCTKAQDEFLSFCEINVVEIGHLYGGKICAALDRQHPRDLFDIHFMLNKVGLTDRIVKGFVFYLIGSNRPFNEMLMPTLIDQSQVFENQFKGMTNESFTYNDFESTRKSLVSTIHDSLTDNDKNFLLSIEEGKPDWSIYNFQDFPAVQWKLKNIEKLKSTNPEKHRIQIDGLKAVLNHQI